MWVFTRNFPARYWIIAPRGFHVADPEGYSWRPPVDGTFGKPSFDMLRPSAEALIQFIEPYAASVGLDGRQFDLMGFSQGAAMASVITLMYPKWVGKLAVLAGFVPHGMEALVVDRPLAGKNIFVAHGTQDQMVPIDRARESMKTLESAGATITYCEDEVGHKLSAGCLRALEKYLED